jgi:arylsulfatase A-like enzyme
VDGRWYELSPQEKTRILDNPVDLHHMIARYDGEVAYVDSQITRLRKFLVQSGLVHNTLVILTSDHGESHGEHNYYFERNLYRSSLQVPLIFNFPQGEVPPLRVSDQVRLIDITPTIMDFLGIEADMPLQGKSLLSMVRGPKGKEERPVFALYHLQPGENFKFALQDKGYKLLWYPVRWETMRWWPFHEELYNVQADPQESENILENSPSVLSDLRRELSDWSRQQVADGDTPTGEASKILKSLGYVQ